MEWGKWPVSSVALAFPVGMPSDVALLGLCDMPADVPVANQYDDAGNALPDPVGICLSMVKFQIHDEGGEKLAEEVGACPIRGECGASSAARICQRSGGAWGRVRACGCG